MIRGSRELRVSVKVLVLQYGTIRISHVSTVGMKRILITHGWTMYYVPRTYVRTVPRQ